MCPVLFHPNSRDWPEHGRKRLATKELPLFRLALCPLQTYVCYVTGKPNSYDVAKLARTSRPVVSAVLNGKADSYRISRETQDRVRDAIRQLGYTPNHAVRNLFLNRCRDDAEAAGLPPDPSRVKAVIESALAAAGYRVQIAALAGDPLTALEQGSGSVHVFRYFSMPY